MKKKISKKVVKARQGLKRFVAVSSALFALVIVLVLSLGAVSLFAGDTNPEGATVETAQSLPKAIAYLGVALAVGLGSIGAGIATAHVATAALSVIAEKPDMMGKTFIYIGLAEGIAIYGVLFGFLIMNAF